MSTVTLVDVVNEIMELRNEMKALCKMVKKVAKVQDDPDGTKRKERAANSGFNRPAKVTSEMASFMGIPEDEMITRSQVTKFVSSYVKDKGLKHPDDGRIIIQDNTLKGLFKVPEGVQLSYLQLQKYIAPHFIKEIKE